MQVNTSEEEQQLTIFQANPTFTPACGPSLKVDIICLLQSLACCAHTARGKSRHYVLTAVLAQWEQLSIAMETLHLGCNEIGRPNKSCRWRTWNKYTVLEFPSRTAVIRFSGGNNQTEIMLRCHVKLNSRPGKFLHLKCFCHLTRLPWKPFENEVMGVKMKMRGDVFYGPVGELPWACC